jgi:hypothetical protein
VVTLLDVRMRVPVGASVVWNGYPYTEANRTATVVMPGPVASSVWALSEFGNWLCLRWHGKRQAWLSVTGDYATALEDQRAVIVAAMVDTELRLRGRRYAFVPDPDHYRNRLGEDDRAWERRARAAELDHDLAVLAQLRARFWAELYGVTQTD